MQQIAVNQMNGTSGGSLRQKLDLSDACQATDAFAMLFMQLMGQTIQPEALSRALSSWRERQRVCSSSIQC